MSRSPSLKWGLILGAIGLGLIIVQFLPYDEDDPIVIGLLMVAAAVGLLADHAMSRRMAAGDVLGSTGTLPPSATALMAPPVQTEMGRTGQTTSVGN